jgi:hypothetical protein
MSHHHQQLFLKLCYFFTPMNVTSQATLLMTSSLAMSSPSRTHARTYLVALSSIITIIILCTIKITMPYRLRYSGNTNANTAENPISTTTLTLTHHTYQPIIV